MKTIFSVWSGWNFIALKYTLVSISVHFYYCGKGSRIVKLATTFI